MKLAAIDRWTLGYVLFASSVLILRWPTQPPGAASLALSHVLLAGLVWLAPRARQTGGLGAFLGDWYPLILTSFLYAEIGTIHTTAPRFFDDLVQALEGFVFGGQPSYDWIRAQPSVWLAWPLHSAYLSYYFIVSVPPIALWLLGRRAAARRLILFVMATFYICYAIFLIFPVAGPRYLFPLAHNAATAVPPAVLAQDLLNSASSRGTAFPSSHVAAALVAAFCAARAQRLLGLIFVPLAILMSLGTVYGQFHYALDALAGAALAIIVLAVERLSAERR